MIFSAVRFGRVPKREKAKMAEEMQKASIRSHIDSMTVELEDDQLLLASIHSAFIELGNAVQRDLINVPARNFMLGDGHESLLNSSHYLPVIMDVINFAKCVKGFPLLYQSDRIQLLKVI
jgi:nuclear receptor subfamily 1 group D protein 3